MSFQNLGLAPELLDAISAKGYTKPTSIQRLAIPKILEGVDVIAGAQTGTGKTAAFTLPILHKMIEQSQSNRKGTTKVLILTPTRELARQVYESVQQYSKNITIRSVVLFGGVDYSSQVKKLNAGAELIVATPGRLMDHVQRGNVELGTLKHLVIDEADRMLDMGFIPEVKRLMSQLPKARQTVFFSATFNQPVRALAKSLLKSPVTIQAEKANSTASRVSHVVHPVDEKNKRPLLSYLIGSNNWQQVLIFTRTKVNADKLSKELSLDGIRNMVIHGDRTQAHRTKALARFKEGKIQALVATDIAARGIDIQNLSHVINYELPNIPEDYVHRVGRTGRAGFAGNAVTLVTDREVFRLDAVQKLIEMKLEQKWVPGFEPKNFDPKLIEKDIKQRKRAKQLSRQGRPEARRSKPSKGRYGQESDSRRKPKQEKTPFGSRSSNQKPRRNPNEKSDDSFNSRKASERPRRGEKKYNAKPSAKRPERSFNGEKKSFGKPAGRKRKPTGLSRRK